ncbi:MAG: hypothetical protein AB1941_18780 [Gemmatimonadota bacterium]
MTTVALLKAQHDSGNDYLEMFMPFVVDAIQASRRNDFDIAGIQQLVENRHGLSIPLDTLQTLLRRAAKRGIVRREAGRYFIGDDVPTMSKIPAQRKSVERQINALADSLISFASDLEFRIDNEEDAKALLFGFLSENQTQLLLEEEESYQYELDTGPLTLEQMRLVARFVTERCLRDPLLSEYLNNVVEGFVLQTALLLRDVAAASRSFKGLQVYFDSLMLFAALGFTGEAAKIAILELMALLRNADALTRVFDVTISEMRAIFGVYEMHLATPEGKERLYPTDLTRHMLTKRFTPADIRQEIALLEHNLKKIGVEIVNTPKRVPEHTYDEMALAKRLKRPSERGDEPRVVHDIDCIAAILTYRRGNTYTSLDEARAIFVTNSGHVVRSVTSWYTDSGLRGTPPIIHQFSLSNAAWLKKPASAAKLKQHELVALCAAALRPSRDTWDKFLRHLRSLEQSGAISSDEAVAIVVSDLTDQTLAEVEVSDPDLDAETLTEVVERVKASYKEEAKASIEVIRTEADQHVTAAKLEVANAVAEKNNAEASRAQIISAVEQRIGRIAHAVSSTIAGLLAMAVVLGVLILFPKVFDVISPRIKWLGMGLAGVASVLTILGLLYGIHVGQIRGRIKSIVQRRLRRWLISDEE